MKKNSSMPKQSKHYFSKIIKFGTFIAIMSVMANKMKNKRITAEAEKNNKVSRMKMAVKSI